MFQMERLCTQSPRLGLRKEKKALHVFAKLSSRGSVGPPSANQTHEESSPYSQGRPGLTSGCQNDWEIASWL